MKKLKFFCRDFIRGNIRGGYDSLAIFRELPRRSSDICLMDFWSPAAKASFTKSYREIAPKHLKSVKGLFLYKWNEDWKSICALIAIVYGAQLSKCLNAVEDFWEDFNGDPTPKWSYNADFLKRAPMHPAVRKEIMVLRSMEKVENLYRESLRYEDELPGEVAVRPNHYELGEIFNILFPEKTLIVVDQSRHILFRRRGDKCPLPEPSAHGFRTGQLNWQTIHHYKLVRVYIFYDHVCDHYVPIFNLDMFLHRRSINVDIVTVDEVAQPKICEKKDRAITFCPCCDAGVEVAAISTHQCVALRCGYCDAYFMNEKDKMTHMNPDVQKATGPCFTCRQKCYGFSCLQAHQAICTGRVFLHCPSCLRLVDQSKHGYHRCQSYDCRNCDSDSVMNPIVYDHRDHPNGYVKYHLCSMRGRTESMESLGTTIKRDLQENKNTQFFVFDFESMLSEMEFRGRRIQIHTVNCISSGELIFSSDSAPEIHTQFTLDEFWTHLCATSTAKTNFWIAHNFKGYDGRLINDYLATRLIAPDGILLVGDKIMQLRIAHPDDKKRSIVFQDSLNHIPSSLEKMPEMFGLPPDIVKKGFFPYIFNTPQHQNYVGPIPPVEYFELDKRRDRDEISSWYFAWALSEKEYNFKREMQEYCENDVFVLLSSLAAYAKIGLEYSGKNPLPYLTIAQFTFDHYRKSYLPPKTIYYLDECFDSFARKAMHGGNTNARRLLYECSPLEAGTLKNGIKGLRYIDIQSLYPTVQYYDPLPVGYPISNVFYSKKGQPSKEKLSSFFGFIECDIHPRRFIFHPIIARYKHSRLFMDLHQHTRVVLTSVEFQTAISERGGYECTHVYRIDEYNQSYDLFKEFVRNWLRLKIISSKLPCDPKDDEAFVKYAEELEKRLQIKVTKSDFAPNPSLRTLAKLVLNSLWGKFGQRTNLIECRVLKTAKEIYEYNQSIRMGNYVEKGERQVGNIALMKKFVNSRKWNKKNIAVAAFVTAHARIRLWNTLAQLGDRVLYHDTDSIVYERRNAKDFMVEEGMFLGEWESETGDNMIHEFVALAPKTYAYKFINDKGVLEEHIKAKGFSITSETKDNLCFNEFKRVLLLAKESFLKQRVDASTDKTRRISVPSTFFRHNIEAGFTFTCKGDKYLQFDYRKGFIDFNTFITYPYGSQKFLGQYMTFQGQLDGVVTPLPKPKPDADLEETEFDAIDTLLT
jgi:DNA polymerase type B, organellar and viral